MAGWRMENGDYVYAAWVLQHRYVLSGGGGRQVRMISFDDLV
jgi:hypothetical protein